jgi:hypothetical protein
MQKEKVAALIDVNRRTYDGRWGPITSDTVLKGNNHDELG